MSRVIHNSIYFSLDTLISTDQIAGKATRRFCVNVSEPDAPRPDGKCQQVKDDDGLAGQSELQCYCTGNYCNSAYRGHLTMVLRLGIGAVTLVAAVISRFWEQL